MELPNLFFHCTSSFSLSLGRENLIPTPFPEFSDAPPLFPLPLASVSQFSGYRELAKVNKH